MRGALRPGWDALRVPNGVRGDLGNTRVSPQDQLQEVMEVVAKNMQALTLRLPWIPVPPGGGTLAGPRSTPRRTVGSLVRRVKRLVDADVEAGVAVPAQFGQRLQLSNP